MRKKLATATALAGSLLLTPLIYGSAQSATIQAPLDSPSNVTLVGKGGGGMGGKGGGGGGLRAGGGGGGGLALRGGGGPRIAGAGPRMRGGDHFVGGRHFKGGKHAFKGHHGKRFHHNHGRHRVFRNGVWVWLTPGYGYDDCGWLRRRAVITGSPYWWSRYHRCIYWG
jgi:hypothetical protein